MKDNKINELYTKAQNILEKKVFSYPGINLFFKELSEENKNELETLLGKFVNTIKLGKEDKIKFKIDGEPQKIKDNQYCDFSIHFSDNINGDSLLFIPTYKHTTKNIIKGYHDVKNQERWEEWVIGKENFSDYLKRTEPEDNRIVSDWCHGETIPNMFGWNDYEISAKIYLFRPKVLTEDNGISIYVNSKDQFKEAIQTFKKKLIKDFLLSSKSPILYRINDLIEIGKESLEKRITEEKKEHAFDDLNDLKEKEF